MLVHRVGCARMESTHASFASVDVIRYVHPRPPPNINIRASRRMARYAEREAGAVFVRILQFVHALGLVRYD